MYTSCMHRLHSSHFYYMFSLLILTKKYIFSLLIKKKKQKNKIAKQGDDSEGKKLVSYSYFMFDADTLEK